MTARNLGPEAAVAALQAFGVSNRVEARVLLGLWQRAAGWPATRRALLARWLQGPRLSPAQVEHVVEAFDRRRCDQPTPDGDGFGFSREEGDPPLQVVPDDCLGLHLGKRGAP